MYVIPRCTVALDLSTLAQLLGKKNISLHVHTSDILYINRVLCETRKSLPAAMFVKCFTYNAKCTMQRMCRCIVRLQ